MRVMGVDPGSVRVGVAVSDSAGRVALPLETLARRDDGGEVARLAELVREREVELVVVGWPLNLRGEAGPAVAQLEAWLERLREALPVPVVTADERLSSALVERSLREAGMDAKARRGKVDAAAAAVILQSYLDAHGKHSPEEA